MRYTSTLRRPVLVALLTALVASLAACGGEAPTDAETGAAPVPDAGVPGDAAAPPDDAEPVATAPAETPEERRKRLLDAAQPEAAPEPAWQPELPASDDASDTDRLERAHEALEAGRVARGPDNALGHFLAVLERDPEHAEARAGVDAIVRALLDRADAALAQDRLDAAARDAAVLARLRPQDAEVTELQRRVEAARELGVLLAEAQRLADRGQELAPPGNNAAQLYADALQRDPDNPAALAGLQRLESSLVAQATAAAEAGDYARSDRLLADAARVRPGSGQVQDASTQIVELRQDRAGELLRQANAAVDGGDLVRAGQLLRQLEQVSVQAQGIEELRTRIEQARLYGGFGPGQAVRDALASGGNAPEMVVVPVGSYRMGSPAGEAERKKNEGPAREVVIARGFAIGRAEVTVAEFGRFVEATGFVTSAERNGRSTIYDERTGSMAERRDVNWRRDHAGRRAEPDLPVVHVSWEDAKAYADWLSRETGATYRLPTEAEFEYVLRAGGQTRYPWGDENPTRLVGNLTGENDRSATQRGWSNAFPDYGDGFWGAAPVRAFRANRFGVHDTEGNVSEWVEDCWHDSYARAPADGSAWVNPGCKARVIRGASWASAPDQARSAFRISAAPATSNARVGFRVARDL